jgi:hypothetical protein
LFAPDADQLAAWRRGRTRGDAHARPLGVGLDGDREARQRAVAEEFAHDPFVARRMIGELLPIIIDTQHHAGGEVDVTGGVS